jgi:hypothetical protein
MEDVMGSSADQVAGVLRDAAETHHRVYRIVDGADADWASWYADWLIRLSRLPEILGATPVPSELVYLLVLLDKEHSAKASDQPWDSFYADRIVEHFGPAAEQGSA